MHCFVLNIIAEMTGFISNKVFCSVINYATGVKGKEKVLKLVHKFDSTNFFEK